MLELMSGVLVAGGVLAQTAGEAADLVVAAGVPSQEAAATSQWAVLGVVGAVIGAGIIVFGAALGIGRIAACACEAIARQPEAGQRIFTSMLLASAFIEGGMLLALIICFLAMWRLSEVVI
jgi:F-type H+-transporting ATPase subunit c